ncbi:MAG TPA: peptidylprolyl isomerase [Actinomycetota bacterium]|nr:peptidylprolyl isomerase [Actinomycetota bacterium]
MKRFLVLASFALVLSSCAELLEPAAAVVDGKKITIDDVNRAVEEFRASAEFKQLGGGQDEGALIRQFEQTHLAQLVRRAVFEPRAAEFGIRVTDKDVQERLEEIKSSFPSQGAFEEALREQGLTLDVLEGLVYDRVLEEQLRAEVTKEAGATEAELRAYYEDNLDKYRETEVWHILVNQRGRAQRLYEQLQATSEEDFENTFRRLARRHSEDRQSGEDGGYLGFFTPGTFVQPFEEAASTLKVGELSRPVRSEFGFHVIWVTDRRTRTFEQARALIEDEISDPAEDAAWQKWVEEAYEEADVRINPRYGELNVETLQIVDQSAESIPGAEVPPPLSPSVSPTN